MRMTEEGLQLIKDFEGCRLESYLDQAGIWTVGYGRTGGVRPSQTISQQEADAWLALDVESVSNTLRAIEGMPPLTDSQFSALVSFCYNVGFGRKGVKDGLIELKTGQPSTMLKELRRGDLFAAAAEFPKWNKIRGIPSPGIQRRRVAEMELFLRDTG